MNGLTNPERPTEVTEENWPELKQQGFTWLTNLGWPMRDDISEESEGEHLQRLYGQYGWDNVKVGHPWNPQEEKPDSTNLAYLIGIYVRK